MDLYFPQLHVKMKALGFLFKLNLFRLIVDMFNARFLGRERTLAAEKETKFLGSASICIETLRF
jgi:hypothetical protein